MVGVHYQVSEMLLPHVGFKVRLYEIGQGSRGLQLYL